MPRVDDKQLALARVYARSLVELARAEERLDELGEELAALAAFLDDRPELADLFASPLVSTEERRAVVEKAFRGRLSDLLVDGLGVINRKGRLAFLPAIAEAYRQEVRDLRGEADVEVVTAVPLSDELRRRLSEAVARFTGRRPQLHERVDPEVLGGLVVRVGDDKFDASVGRELERVGDLLAARASTEILSGKAYFTDSESDADAG